VTEPRQTIQQTIGLALSGGGVRAAAFHAGVLRYLAEKGLLERVTHVSSVSGGSLFAGMVFRLNEYEWPSSVNYLVTVYPQFRRLATTKSLQRAALRRLLLNPLNWRFLLSRANVLAEAIRELWDVRASLSSLPVLPVWSINGTTAETGRRFRFKAQEMGDYELGYAPAQQFCLAHAMAVSAAFPGGIGPLSIKVSEFEWQKGARIAVRKSHVPPFERLHLYDGGLYDNLGMEPLFDIGRRETKLDGEDKVRADFIVVSDGGAPLERRAVPHPLNPFRFKRIADIALDKCRALRVRVFLNYISRQPTSGLFLGIGADAGSSIKAIVKGQDCDLSNYEWLVAEKAREAARVPTSLRQMTEEVFDLVARHGYETAKWNFELSRRPM